jgi:hypothetical protein
MGSSRNRISRLWHGCLLLVVAAGCAESGHPSVVKISPDSRFVVYEDCRYARVYVYDVKAEKRHAVPGVLAFMDPSVTRLILLPDRVENLVILGQIRPSLISIGEKGVVVDRLPSLPGRPLINDLYLRLLAEQGEVQAIIYRCAPGTDPKAGREYYTLRFGQDAWLRQPFPEIPFARLNDRSHDGVLGARATGPVYAPTALPDPAVALSAEQSSGIGVKVDRKWIERIGEKDVRLQYELTSPDETFRVTIGDLKDIWGRVWLTRQADQRRIILLDKNDAPLEVLTVPSSLCLGLFMWLFGIH